MESNDTREVTGWRIAISGSRELDGKIAHYLVYNGMCMHDWPISRYNFGDARGIDAAAENVCESLDIDYVKYHADWSEHGKAAGPIRNDRMLQESDALIAIRLNGSAGTSDAIDRAKKYNLPTLIIDIDK